MANLPALLRKALTSTGNALLRAGYVGGQRNRLTETWLPKNRTGDAEISKSYKLLTARGRWLARNNPWTAGAKRTIVNHVIGTGIKTKAAVRNAQGELETVFNKASDELYLRWMEEADATGRSHWYEMTRTGLHATIESGENLYVECVDPNPARVSPLCYELIEADQIDTTRDRPAGDGQNEIRRGIEFDKQGRRVAYYLFTQHPGGLYTRFTESERVLSRRVIHLFRADRSTQTRGVTWFAPIVTPLWDSYEYMRSEISAAKIASYFVYLWRKQSGVGGGFGLNDETSGAPDNDAFGNLQEALYPGIGLEGEQGDGLDVIQSSRPSSDAVPWLKFMLQMMGVGTGLSYQKFTGDFSQTSFSAARAADNQDWTGFRPLQNWHSWYVDLEVRKRVTQTLVADPTTPLPIPNGGVTRFRRNPHRWLQCKSRPPGSVYIDPQKQIAASRQAIESGLSTWEIELASIGQDRDDVFETLAEEQRMIRDLGLEVVLGNQGRIVSEEEEEEEEPEQMESPRVEP